MAIGCSRLFNTTIGIATTGYAEPSTSIKQAHAYWAIYFKKPHFSLYTGQIIIPKTTSRASAQKYVAREIHRKLRELLIKP